MIRAVQRALVRFLIAVGVLTAIVLVYRKLLPVNLTTVGFTFLVAVLIVSATWGLPYAVFMAVAATAAFNYFFFPPVGTFTISDPQNWIALLAFLVTGIIASHLSARARREALDADKRRHEAERLYGFSQQLLVTENVLGLTNAIPRLVVESFSLAAAALYLSSRQETYYSDVATRGILSREQLQAVTSRGEPTIDSARGIAFVPLRMGVRTLGGLAVVGSAPSREILEAIGSLIAIAVERAGAVEQLTKTEAARESEKLRSALLDSVTHEFRTPLTGIKAAVTSLLSNLDLQASERKDLLTVIDEESDRLNRLVGEAAEMAQLDAGQVELHLQPHHIREAVDGALQDAKHALTDHPLQVYIPENLPPANMDLGRIREVLQHLLENAGKYSPPQSPIQVSSEARGGKLVTSVADRGPGIDDFEQLLIFEKFYRGRAQRSAAQGTGMGLAIARAIVEAHGGTIGVISQAGRGSVFHFSLPV